MLEQIESETIGPSSITGNTALPRVLLVDDNEQVRSSLKSVLEFSSFHVTTAAGVSEALHLIDTESFDVLLSDLHMPGAGDGFTVISAMHHKNPKAVKLVFSGFPALEAAMNAILLQADEVLVKPMSALALVSLIRAKLHQCGTRLVLAADRVASILEAEASAIINHWFVEVEKDYELACVPLTREQRIGQFPQLLDELILRLRTSQNYGTKFFSRAAFEQGRMRNLQGYSAPMLVEESRIFHGSIFFSLQSNLGNVDFSLLLPDLRTLADEVDWQLKYTMTGFTELAQRAIA
jgi:DNA-binding response OmpR family regulator